MSESIIPVRRQALRIGTRAMAAVLCTSFLAACNRTALIYNAEHVDFIGSAPLPTRTVQIQRAAASLGWVAEPQGPGVVRAALNLRSHQVTAAITYDPRQFSITYLSSANLLYDGTHIHRNYNSWIANLRDKIVEESGR